MDKIINKFIADSARRMTDLQISVEIYKVFGKVVSVCAVSRRRAKYGAKGNGNALLISREILCKGRGKGKVVDAEITNYIYKGGKTILFFNIELPNDYYEILIGDDSFILNFLGNTKAGVPVDHFNVIGEIKVEVGERVKIIVRKKREEVKVKRRAGRPLGGGGLGGI